jgi:hypothetical protein
MIAEYMGFEKSGKSRPIICVRAVFNIRAAELARYPSSSTTSKTRFLVATEALAFGSLFTILETKLGSTFASLATSRIVALWGFATAKSLSVANLHPKSFVAPPSAEPH